LSEILTVIGNVVGIHYSTHPKQTPKVLSNHPHEYEWLINLPDPVQPILDPLIIEQKQDNTKEKAPDFSRASELVVGQTLPTGHHEALLNLQQQDLKYQHGIFGGGSLLHIGMFMMSQAPIMPISSCSTM
jgi:hypothetical protein